MSARATSAQETPFFVRAGSEDVFGILTEPVAQPRGTAVLILSGGAFIGATNRNQLSVRMARAAAADGYHALRIDYHGVGESSGEIDVYRLDEPFVDDVLAAVRWIEELGVRDIAFVGTTCFGSRTALATAESVERLRGVACFATPLRDVLHAGDPEATLATVEMRRALRASTLRGLLDPKRRRRYARILKAKARAALHRAPAQNPAASDVMSARFYEPLAALAGRGTPVLLAYGTDDDFFRDFEASRAQPRLSALLDAPGSSIDVRVVPGSIHALRRLSAQDDVLATTADWLRQLPSGSPTAAGYAAAR